MLKFAIFLVISFSIIQQSLAWQIVGFDKETAKHKFDKLTAVVDNASSEIQMALNLVDAKTTELQEKANLQIYKSMVPLEEKLNGFIEIEMAKGVDISKCEKYIDSFSNTPIDLEHNLMDCFNQKVSNAQSYANDALNNIRKIKQDLNDVNKDIDNCPDNKLEQYMCTAKFVEKMTKDTEEAPLHIAEDVSRVTFSAITIIPFLEQCFTNQLLKAELSATRDVLEFATCSTVGETDQGWQTFF